MRAALVVALLAGCAPPAPADDAGVDAGDVAPDALAALHSIDDVALLADVHGAVKWLAPVDGAPARAPITDCVFQNTTRFPYHIVYLNQIEGSEELTYDDYLALVLRRATRVWWGGEVAWKPSLEHPLTAEPGVLAYALYTEDSTGNRLEIDDVRDVHAILVECAPELVDALAFVPSSNEQRDAAAGFASTLAGEGIGVLEP